MSQINSKIKDDFKVFLLLSCFVGHPVLYIYPNIYYRPVFYIQTPLCDSFCFAPLQHNFRHKKTMYMTLSKIFKEHILKQYPKYIRIFSSQNSSNRYLCQNLLFKEFLKGVIKFNIL